jgi:hypothetical protein
MKTYKFVLIPSSEISRIVDIGNTTRQTVIAKGRTWQEALDTVDPECKMYMYSSITLSWTREFILLLRGNKMNFVVIGVH